jgi:glycosyltransferase involved in cell wall biosynthesis
MPRVSVVIPAYNRAGFVARTVRSVLGQTFRDFEVIVVDDGSTDDTYQKVEEFGDPRISILRHTVNRGAQAARNSGLRAARGELVAFLDSDDEWLPTSLSLQVACFETASASLGVAYGICRWYYDCERRYEDRAPRISVDEYRSLLAHAELPIITLLVRRTCFDKIGEFDEGIIAYQEWDLAIRLAKHYRFEFVPDVLAIYHIHSAPTISKNLSRSAQGYLDVVEKHRSEIEEVCGRETLAAHYLRASEFFLEAGDLAVSRRLFSVWAELNPFAWPLWAHLPVLLGWRLPHRIVRLLRHVSTGRSKTMTGSR